MTYDQITGILRAIIPAVLAWLAGAGYIPGESVGAIGAAIAAVAAAIWSVYSNKPSVLVQKVAAMPEVEHIAVSATPAGVALKNAAGSTPTAEVIVTR